MARNIRTYNRSFAGGEVSPEMYGRIDDVRFQNGAALLQNLIAKPQGPALKRPGLEFVREVKDSTQQVRLLPFKFSESQTLALEFGNVSENVDAGYIRFHTQGATVLHDQQPAYVDPQNITGITPATNLFTVAADHGLQTGDPIVLTMTPSLAITSFSAPAGSPGIVNVTGHNLSDGDQVIFKTDEALATPLEAYRIYYVNYINTSSFNVSLERGLDPIEFSDAGAGTSYIGGICAATNDYVDANVIYYAIVVGTKTFRLAKTKVLAQTGTPVQIDSIGTGSARLHYGYVPGDMTAYNNGVTYYCMRRPWGDDGGGVVRPEDHLDHPPTNDIYWYAEPAIQGTVTFDLVNDEVDWVAHGRSEGEAVIFSTTGTLPTGITAGTVYYLRNVTVDAFQLSSSAITAVYDGSIIDLDGSPAGTHTALVGSIYEVPHYYNQSQLFDINYAQSADVMTLVHPERPAAELRRYGATNWVLEDIIFNAAVKAPKGVAVSGFAGKGTKVSSITSNPGTNDLVTTSNAHDLLPGDPIHITDVGTLTGYYQVHSRGPTTPLFELYVGDLESGEKIEFPSTSVPSTARIRYTPITQAWDGSNSYVVTAVNDDAEESTYSAIVSSTTNLFVEGAFNTITWNAVDDAVRYRIYKRQSGVFGYIGEVNASLQLSFKDDNIGPDLSATPPIYDNALLQGSEVTFNLARDVVNWADHGFPAGTPVTFFTTDTMPTNVDHRATYFVVDPEEDTFGISATPTGTAIGIDGSYQGTIGGRGGAFPATVAYFEQRRCFGGSIIRPHDVWMTGSSTESDVSYSIPSKDDDRILFRISSRELTPVRHIIPLDQLLLLSSAVEFRVTPLNNDAITPSSISVRPQSFIGSSTVQPATVNNAVVFAAARGGHLREIGYSEQVRGYLTGDLSLRAAHLFDDYEIVQTTYAKAPIPIIWMVSTSGKLLALTYIPEEQVGAWHQHVTDGTFESCISIPEGEEDRLYVVVKRNINGQDVRYVERMGVQSVDQIEDAFFVDAGISYSGPAAAVFGSLGHLEGETVAILADGVVQSSQVVTGAQITLAAQHTDVKIGLPYTARMQTLPLVLQIEGFGQDRTKNINRAAIRVYESGSFLLGPDSNYLVGSVAQTAGTLLSATNEVPITGTWSDDGQIVVEQATPLPLTLVSVVLEAAVGG